MQAGVVTSDEELGQIIALSHKNLRKNISEEDQAITGFITWMYSLDLLRQMNAQHPHVIVKDNDKVIGYALVALKEASVFHHDLKGMMLHLETLTYEHKSLSEYKYYVMGQVCVDNAYRGKGVFPMLYEEHKKLFRDEYDFVITEISTINKRSMAAHKKTGFKTIHTYRDALDEWNVVLWDWN